MGGRAGVLGTSRVVLAMRSFEFVLRLSWLGFLFIPGIVGLIKDGEAGSDVMWFVVLTTPVLMLGG